MKNIQLVERAKVHASRRAIASGGKVYSYSDLLGASARVAGAVLDGEAELREARVAFLIPSSFEYAAVQWGVWRAGGVAVPLSMHVARPELEYFLTDSGARTVCTVERLAGAVEPVCSSAGLRLVTVEEALAVEPAVLPDVSPDSAAMILYTSGTTSKPKGVVTTHANIEAQITSLVEAWAWHPDDRIPLFLPLHHVHGIVNVLSCALWTGAFVETFETFDIDQLLTRVGDNAYTVFMAVPTIYVKLIQALESAAPEVRQRWADGFSRMRLMVSGSAALPARVHDEWAELTGQRLLERYGMTEIGMGISNPLDGDRRAGAVGQPLPGVELRLVSESGAVIDGEGEPGEIQVKGPGVFAEYWNRPEATAEAFVDGWFKTGDMAVLERGYYRILGRLSVDIIKSGGYKLSALEIEDTLRQHPAIKECAVVGVPDDTWGDVVAVAVVTREGTGLALEELRTWAGERLSKYKVPSMLEVVSDFPRNAMGKVMKPAVRDLFVSGDAVQRQPDT